MRSPPNPVPAGRATTLRVFFALWPDADARDRLAALAQDVAARTQGRAPPSLNLHVTVAFIGEIDAGRIDALRAIGASVAPNVPPFVLMLDRAGTFRGTGIAWAGCCPATSRKPDRSGRLVCGYRSHRLD